MECPLFVQYISTARCGHPLCLNDRIFIIHDREKTVKLMLHCCGFCWKLLSQISYKRHDRNVEKDELEKLKKE